MADQLASATDFANKQFAKAEVASKVVEQYDDAKTRLFYQITMGALPSITLYSACSAIQADSYSPPQVEYADVGGPHAGGGGHDIHYGIFRKPTDGVRESSAASTEFMMTCMDWARPVRLFPRRGRRYSISLQCAAEPA